MKAKPIIVMKWLFCFLMSPSVMSQDRDTLVVGMQEVVLTAQRMKTQSLQTPFSIDKISRKNLDEYVLRTTPEAMMQLNGVFVQKTNHGGGSAFVRGLTGNQVLIMMDGIRLNNSTFRYGPNQYLNTIDPYTINNIEVLRGTGAVQYGTDALGGVIQVFTKEPEFTTAPHKWAGQIMSRYVSRHMEQTGRAEFTFSSPKTAMNGGMTYRDFGDLFGGDTTGRQSPSGYREMAADFKLRHKIQPDWELILAQQMVLQDRVPVYHKIVLENFAINEMDPQRRMLGYVRLRGNTRNRLFQQAEITASWQHNREGRNSRKNGSESLRREEDKINSVGLTVNFAATYGKNWTAHSGIEFYSDRVYSSREDLQMQTGVYTGLRGLYPDGSGYRNYSLYSLHQFQYGKFVVMAGARFNVFDIRITDTTLGKVQIFPSAIVGNAAILYQPGQQQSVYVSVSNGYRAPNIDDMGTLGIVDFRYELPSADLRPEKSVHTELGYKLNSKKLSGEISVFYLQLKDIITRVKMEGEIISGYQVYRKENSEKAKISGVEAKFSWQAMKNFKVTGQVSYAHGQNQTRQEPLRRIPPLNSRFQMVYRNKIVFAALETCFASRQNRLAQGDKEDNRIPKGGTPGWNLFNLYTGVQLKKARIHSGVQNIFNEDYRTHGSGINGAGRNLFISIIFNL